MNNPGVQSLYPVFRYRDPDAAVDWLGQAFGCEERVVYRDDDDGFRHGELRLEGNLVMVGLADEAGWLGGEEPRPLGSTGSVYVAVDDVDAHHARARTAGAKIVRELVDQPYGSREYSARDLEGNLWSFGTYRPSADERSGTGS
jgi:uncharacterized glyoxalase superfamily protein PhnB